MQPKNKTVSHEIPGKARETMGADVFSLNNKHYLCIVEVHSKFPVITHIDTFSADNLLKHVQLFLQNMGSLVN